MGTFCYVAVIRGVRLRPEPSTSKKEKCVLLYGTTVEVISTRKIDTVTWASVTVGGKTGYVMAQYLKPGEWTPTPTERFETCGSIGYNAKVERCPECRGLREVGRTHAFRAEPTYGWNCPGCGAFNGEEKEIHTTCRCCEHLRP